MTAKQKLKMAEAQIAYWKAVASEAKKDIRASGVKKRAAKTSRRHDPRQIDLEDLIKKAKRPAKKAQRKARKATRRARTR